MTEAEWLACDHPQEMLDRLRGCVSRRKERLCAAAWARAFVGHAAASTTPWLVAYQGWLADPRWLLLLDAAERFADGAIDQRALRAFRLESGGPYNLYLEATRVSHFSLAEAYRSLRGVQGEFAVPSDQEICDLIRDIIKPSPPPPPASSWLTWQDSTVSRIAQGIYDERAFDRLPILADALLDAGCDNEDILAHCRSEGPHVRGCWVIDLLLGKT
jgi:hypothetical protein